jgi:hypothetical protein
VLCRPSAKARGGTEAEVALTRAERAGTALFSSLLAARCMPRMVSAFSRQIASSCAMRSRRRSASASNAACGGSLDLHRIAGSAQANDEKSSLLDLPWTCRRC